MQIDPEYISLEMKSLGPIHRDSPEHYVSTIEIDILYGDELEKIGEGRAYEVRMDHILDDDAWSLFDVFEAHSSDLYDLYDELFEDDELIPSVESELCDYGNVVLIKSIVLRPECRGQGLGGILALAIAERFGPTDIVALKPWPMNPHGHDDPGGVWALTQLTEPEQKAVAEKLRTAYRGTGFKEFFEGSSHLFLTQLRHPTATELMDNQERIQGQEPILQR